MKLVNLYYPNNKALSLNALPAVEDHYLVVGDFNSHSQSWGYDQIDKRGEEVENWQDDHRLNLINTPEDQPTFYSGRWRTTSTLDLAFRTDDIDGQINREVREQLGGSDHRPVLLTFSTYISCESTLPRWNCKKADWTLYSQLTDQVTKHIRVEGRDINKVVKDFNAGILTVPSPNVSLW